MSDADQLRTRAQLFADIAEQLSDRAAAQKLRSEAASLLAHAIEVDARDKSSQAHGARSHGASGMRQAHVSSCGNLLHQTNAGKGRKH